jgi:hypothetical protein
MRRNCFGNIMQLPVLSALALFLLAGPLFILTSCSDTERRMIGNEAMSTVLINLGTSKSSTSGRMAATAPENITTVTVTVTGPGMTPIVKTLSTAPPTIDLSVPSGPARLFSAVVTTTNGIYAGTALASLPAGSTVSVPIVMRFGGAIGFKNEGSPTDPVFVESSLMGSITHIGQVGTGYSYYYMDPGIYEMVDVSIKELTDDADLWGYGFSTVPNFAEMEPLQFKKNFCGRTKDENIFSSNPGGGSMYYFAIDGSHTKAGARYVIVCTRNNGLVTGPPPIGTSYGPIIVPVGLPYDTRVVPTDLNYYTSVVMPGRTYWINSYFKDFPFTITLYQDNFVTALPGNTFTAMLPFIFYDVEGQEMETTLTVEVVANEGSPAAPVELYSDEFYQTGRANFCMVGGAGGSSYYRVRVSGEFFLGYRIKVTSIQGDVSLTVYRSGSFASPDLFDFSNTSLTGDEEVSGTLSDFPDGYAYIKVSDMNGSGSTFVLNVMGDIF